MLLCELRYNCLDGVPVSNSSKYGDYAPGSAACHLRAWKAGIERSGDQFIANRGAETALSIGNVGLKEKFAGKLERAVRFVPRRCEEGEQHADAQVLLGRISNRGTHRILFLWIDSGERIDVFSGTVEELPSTEGFRQPTLESVTELRWREVRQVAIESRISPSGYLRSAVRDHVNPDTPADQLVSHKCGGPRFLVRNAGG